MSHHYSGPDFGFPRGDARLDFTDLYAFPKPGDPRKSILIMNVHPSAVVDPPGRTTTEPFAPDAVYEFKIDTNSDAVADIAYRVRFSSTEGGSQTATLRRVEGAVAAGMGDGGQLIIEGAPVSTSRDARVTEADGYRFFAGWRSEPFFFDVRGAKNNLQFTGDDFFADKGVCSVVQIKRIEKLSLSAFPSTHHDPLLRIIAHSTGSRVIGRFNQSFATQSRPKRTCLGPIAMSAQCHVWTAPSWQGIFSRCRLGRCSHVFGLWARFT
jgi:Domain of unknown function (DUF4331)